MNSSALIKKFHLVTFGCQMNVYDSNLIAAELENAGFCQTPDIADADLIVVNTCSVRAGAEERAYARIRSMRYHKKRRPGLKIAVVGCMAQNHGEKITEVLEHVDYVIGPDNYGRISELFAADRSDVEYILVGQNNEENYDGIQAKFDSQVSANIAVMRGCNQRCAYCIVPHVRGKERSRSPEDVEHEVRNAVQAGIPEVILLGQTVNSYQHGEDNFASLLRKLNGIEGLERIRFTSPHPIHCSPPFISAMAECEKVCRHLHLPVQSGSSAILRKMKRGYTREKYLGIIESLRKAVPHIGITTDIITGFVGESEQDFEDTLSLVREVRFDAAFMFSYSPREGTPAALETETLSEAEKLARLQKLIRLQNRITTERVEAMIGRNETILLEGPSRKDKQAWVGKTSCFKKAVIPPQSHYHPGMLVDVLITGRKGNTLLGIESGASR